MARRKLHYLADGQTVQGVDTPAAITADGSTAAIDWEGGNGAFLLAGTVGGGTYTLQGLAPDNTTWLSVGSNTTLTAQGAGGFSWPAGKLRVTTTGSTTPSIKAWVVGIPTNEGG